MNSTQTIVDAVYCTTWDTGAILDCPCKVDTLTGEVLSIQMPQHDYDNLQGEFVVLDGKVFPVHHGLSHDANRQFIYMR